MFGLNRILKNTPDRDEIEHAMQISLRNLCKFDCAEKPLRNLLHPTPKEIRQYQGSVRRLKIVFARLQLVFAVPILSAIAMAPAIGDDYSFEEEQACTGDAFRLCSEFIPDIPRITSCMQAKHDQLSPRCAKMFAPGRDRHLNDPGQAPHDADQ